MAELLDDAAVQSWLDGHPGWTREDGTIVRTVACTSFPAAIDLVCRVADLAEDRDHHPDIDIRWRTLRFALSTHSAGGLTQLDLELATDIDRLASSATAD